MKHKLFLFSLLFLFLICIPTISPQSLKSLCKTCIDGGQVWCCRGSYAVCASYEASCPANTSDSSGSILTSSDDCNYSEINFDLRFATAFIVWGVEIFLVMISTLVMMVWKRKYNWFWWAYTIGIGCGLFSIGLMIGVLDWNVSEPGFVFLALLVGILPSASFQISLFFFIVPRANSDFNFVDLDYLQEDSSGAKWSVYTQFAFSAFGFCLGGVVCWVFFYELFRDIPCDYWTLD